MASMHIVKQENGMYKVTIKKMDCQFFVEDYNQALKIAFKLAEIEKTK